MDDVVEVLLNVVVLDECGSTNGWTVGMFGYQRSKSQWVVISVNCDIDFTTRFERCATISQV